MQKIEYRIEFRLLSFRQIMLAKKTKGRPHGQPFIASLFIYRLLCLALL